MAKYMFMEWTDETGAIVGTTPSVSIPITANKTLTAVYAIEKRVVTYKSTPLSVNALVDTTTVPSGSAFQVDDGTTIVLSVPSEVTA